MTDTHDHPPRYIEYLPLGTLLDMRDPTNVKGHAEDVIADSLDRFGYIEPIVVDERTGKLIAGHGRLGQLQLLAATATSNEPATPPEGIVCNDAAGGWLVPVVRGWRSTDDDEAHAAGIALNRAGEVGGWTDGLAAMLAELNDSDGGMPPGFTPDDLDTLLAELGDGELPDQGTDAAHADDLSGRGDPAVPRQQQGFHEVGLMFQADHHAEFLSLLAQLRQLWGAEMPTPMLVLRALRLALEAG